VRLLIRFFCAKPSSRVNSKRQLLTNVDCREDFDFGMKQATTQQP
jgi:hypothetical protein